ncbi:hypothetical protein OYC64_001250 [Pagothenia borchgrevinki]|uniref:Ig-like domain-containing protein n=1 Tax=Pagothenia borchgrevinki TaxID=8213 RepID=A0ABD2GC39_PAGBO
MAAHHVGLFMLLWIGSVAAGDLEKVKAKPGENVTLQCSSSTDAAITVLKWRRPGLKKYVFYYRDNMAIEIFQDPRYRGRVELKDPEMKNRDVSVLLKNVNTNDTGKYECEVTTQSNNRRKRDLGDNREFVRSIHLIVSEGPENVEQRDGQPQSGQAALRAGPGFVSLLLLLLVDSCQI